MLRPKRLNNHDEATGVIAHNAVHHSTCDRTTYRCTTRLPDVTGHVRALMTGTSGQMRMLQ